MNWISCKQIFYMEKNHRVAKLLIQFSVLMRCWEPIFPSPLRFYQRHTPNSAIHVIICFATKIYVFWLFPLFYHIFFLQFKLLSSFHFYLVLLALIYHYAIIIKIFLLVAVRITGFAESLFGRASLWSLFEYNFPIMIFLYRASRSPHKEMAANLQQQQSHITTRRHASTHTHTHCTDTIMA